LQKWPEKKIHLAYSDIFLFTFAQTKQKPKQKQNMKNLKQSIVAIAAIALIAPVLHSCSKVTPKKLNGEWVMESGTVKTTEVYAGQTSTVVNSYDGAKETSKVSIPGSAETTTTSPFTMTIKFDKEKGTYTKTTFHTTTKVGNNITPTFKKDAAGNYIDWIYVAKETTAISKMVEDGIFTVTGGTGDIEDNSEVVFRTTASNITSDETYKYYEYNQQSNSITSTVVAAAGRFAYTNANNTEPLKTTGTNTSSNTGKALGEIVYKVDELDDNMKISAEYSSKRVVGNVTSESATTQSWTFKKK
jgi:hypothetical protein